MSLVLNALQARIHRAVCVKGMLQLANLYCQQNLVSAYCRPDAPFRPQSVPRVLSSLFTYQCNSWKLTDRARPLIFAIRLPETAVFCKRRVSGLSLSSCVTVDKGGCTGFLPVSNGLFQDMEEKRALSLRDAFMKIAAGQPGFAALLGVCGCPMLLGSSLRPELFVAPRHWLNARICHFVTIDVLITVVCVSNLKADEGALCLSLT